ncbi:hypothetical protein GCK72_022132 [Caenorhabditis remanei]|uniref:ENTH domain-containing protein n=1 Tax=Caenorhabditis remanei TaxID=31234 RepID=A0A6A5FT50_CAERE|nr:hypothetical protein GCK72_022132 [Caenorhabditis remanei]KAF1745685.1 hypothetical protein GCK72_022132 [Caenorhabditis remanei]
MLHSLRQARRSLKNVIAGNTLVIKKTLFVTSNDRRDIRDEDVMEISDATWQSWNVNGIVSIVMNRLNDHAQPTHKLKAAYLLHYLLIHGSQKIFKKFSRHIERLQLLSEYPFGHKNHTNLVQDMIIKDTLRNVLRLLTDPEFLEKQQRDRNETYPERIRRESRKKFENYARQIAAEHLALDQVAYVNINFESENELEDNLIDFSDKVEKFDDESVSRNSFEISIGETSDEFPLWKESLLI